MDCILTVYQHLSTRAGYEGINNRKIIKTSTNNDDESTFFGIDLLGTFAMIFGCAFVALTCIQLAIAAVFSFSASKKLVVVSFWNRINFVQSIGIWFRKPPKQPGKSKGRILSLERSQLTERTRGRQRTTIILVRLLYFCVIGRIFSFSFRRGTFENGAR